MDTEPTTSSETESAATPTPKKALRMRDMLLIGGGASIALIVALVAGVPFGSAEDAHAGAAPAESHAEFPPKLEDEATRGAEVAPATEAPHADSQPAVVAPLEVAATATAEEKPALSPSLSTLVTQWQRAMALESSGDVAGAVSTLRAAIAELSGEHRSVRRFALLALGAMEARRGQTAFATRAFADADAVSQTWDGAELLAFARTCLDAAAPRLARMACARTSLVLRGVAAADPALVLSVTRMHAEALEAEWRATHGAFVLAAPSISFEGGQL